jgi:hypothetical protein
MATTDARSGFRLPWSSDRSTETDESTVENPAADAADGAWSPDATVTDADVTGAETVAGADAPADVSPASPEEAPVMTPVDVAPAQPATKKPNKFLADLTKAMQAAAEEARGRALSQLQADAKTHVESIHGRSSTEAADLRKAADDDVASIREWSKAEIARVREETEQKITDRKSRLEGEIEEHAAFIEREIEAVQGMVSKFENEMAAFFEHLLVEDDPSRFAAMAENLPEPPTFDDLSAVLSTPVARTTEPETVAAEVATDDATEAASDAEAQATEPVATAEPAEAVETTEATETTEVADEAEGTSDAEPVGTVEADPAADGDPSTDGVGLIGLGDGETPSGIEGDEEMDREAAFAAIQAAAEAAASAEVAADAAARAEAVADVAIEIIGNHEDGDTEQDPRFAALGLSPDYDAAEAEALAAADSSEGEEIPTIGDDALAARLAGLVPSKGKSDSGDAVSTQVVVVGLISVASIASFKRHLGRIAGVQSVGVSSGPDGEFVFTVTHAADAALRDAIPSLPSFQARVTSSAQGSIHVTAHDPEADA